MPTADQQKWTTRVIDRMVYTLVITLALFIVQSYLLPVRQQWIPKVIESLEIDYQVINWLLNAMNVIANDDMATLGVIAIGGCTAALCVLVMHKINDLIAGITALRRCLVRTVLTVVLSLTGYITGIPILYFLNTVIRVWERWLEPLYRTAERWSMRRIRAFKQWIVSRYEYHKELWDDELRAEGRTEGRAEGIAEGEAKGRAETLDRMVAAGKLTPQERDEFLNQPDAENPGSRQPYLNPE